MSSTDIPQGGYTNSIDLRTSTYALKKAFEKFLIVCDVPSTACVFLTDVQKLIKLVYPPWGLSTKISRVQC